MNAYVALGDSFTSGTGAGPGRRWPDLLAAALGGPGWLVYENLAEHGATSAQVRTQVSRAIQLEPDLVTVVCGANDLLQRKGDPVEYSKNLSAILGALADALPGVKLVTATAPEQWEFLPLGPRTRARLERDLVELNKMTRAVATVHGAAVLDVAGHPGLSRPENFDGDGLHPSPLGHKRAAEGFGALIADSFGVPLREEALR